MTTHTLFILMFVLASWVSKNSLQLTSWFNVHSICMFILCFLHTIYAYTQRCLHVYMHKNGNWNLKRTLKNNKTDRNRWLKPSSPTLTDTEKLWVIMIPISRTMLWVIQRVASTWVVNPFWPRNLFLFCSSLHLSQNFLVFLFYFDICAMSVCWLFWFPQCFLLHLPSQLFSGRSHMI